MVDIGKKLRKTTERNKMEGDGGGAPKQKRRRTLSPSTTPTTTTTSKATSSTPPKLILSQRRKSPTSPSQQHHRFQTKDIPRTHAQQQQHAQPSRSTPFYMNIDEFFTQCNTCDTNNTPEGGGGRMRTAGGGKKPANTSNIKDSTSLVSPNLHLQPTRRSNNAPISNVTMANFPPNSSTAPPHRTHKHRGILEEAAAAIYEGCPPLTTTLTEEEKKQILARINSGRRRIRSDEVYEETTPVRHSKSGSQPSTTTHHTTRDSTSRVPPHMINNPEFDDPNLRKSSAIPFNSPSERHQSSFVANPRGHNTRRPSVITASVGGDNRYSPPLPLPISSVVVVEPAEQHALQTAGKQRKASDEQRISIIASPEKTYNDKDSDYSTKKKDKLLDSRISEKLNTIITPPPPSTAPPISKSSTTKRTPGYSIDNRHHRRLDTSATTTITSSSRSLKDENIDVLFTKGRDDRFLTPDELEPHQSGDYSPQYEEDEDIEVYGSDTSEVYNIEGVSGAGGEEGDCYDTKESVAESLMSLKNHEMNTTYDGNANNAFEGGGGQSGDPQQQPKTSAKKRGGGKPGRRRKRGYIYDPKPLVPKSKTSTLPEELKDDDYWTRRQRNNEAAKRSRENRRVKELEMMSLVKNLTNTNTELRNRIKELEERNNLLEQVLKRNPIVDNSGYESSD